MCHNGYVATGRYSTDDELRQQEVLVIIGYNKTIMSMSDDFGT